MERGNFNNPCGEIKAFWVTKDRRVKQNINLKIYG